MTYPVGIIGKPKMNAASSAVNQRRRKRDVSDQHVGSRSEWMPSLPQPWRHQRLSGSRPDPVGPETFVGGNQFGQPVTGNLSSSRSPGMRWAWVGIVRLAARSAQSTFRPLLGFTSEGRFGGHDFRSALTFRPVRSFAARTAGHCVPPTTDAFMDTGSASPDSASRRERACVSIPPPPSARRPPSVPAAAGLGPCDACANQDFGRTAWAGARSGQPVPPGRYPRAGQDVREGKTGSRPRFAQLRIGVLRRLLRPGRRRPSPQPATSRQAPAFLPGLRHASPEQVPGAALRATAEKLLRRAASFGLPAHSGGAITSTLPPRPSPNGNLRRPRLRASVGRRALSPRALVRKGRRQQIHGARCRPGGRPSRPV